MIKLNDNSLRKMIGDAESTYPDECCGFLFGYEKDGVRFIKEACAVVNSKEGDKRRRFIISPKDYMQAEIFAEENDLTLLGIYHSHPNHPAIPSEHDRVAAQPFFSYIIISVKEKYVDLRSWRLNDEHQFEEENVAEKKYTN